MAYSVFSKCYDVFHKTPKKIDMRQGVSLIVGSLFMLASRLVHDKGLRKRW